MILHQAGNFVSNDKQHKAMIFCHPAGSVSLPPRAYTVQPMLHQLCCCHGKTKLDLPTFVRVGKRLPV